MSRNQTVTVMTKPRRHRGAVAGGVQAFFRGIALGGLGMGLVVLLTATAYVAKSAAGIDLIEGRSALHASLWPVARNVRDVIRQARR